MGIIEDFIERVKTREGFRFDKEVADFIGINKESLASAKQRGQLPNTYTRWYCEKYNIPLDRFHQDIKLTNTTMDLGGSNPMEAQKIIDNQERLIHYQEKEILQLKEVINKKQAESTHWEALEYDFTCNVTLVRKGLRFGRVIESVTDLDRQAQTLGYRPEEIEKFWDIGVTHSNMEDHPIEAIINKETQKEIQKQISTLPIIFDAMKAVVGNHYIPQPIIYKHKNGTNIGAISYNKVEWVDMKVFAKIKFLVSE